MSELIIFANSIKKQQRCIAGKSVTTRQWIRPVASADGAELEVQRCFSLTASRQRLEVKPLQRITMELGAAVPLINQPENYQISDQPWHYRGELAAHQLEPYLDTPDSLWGGSNRVAYSEIEAGRIVIGSSLLLVRVDGLKLQLEEYNGRLKRRAYFTYRGLSYNLPVTDPSFMRQCQHPDHHSILCVSLGEKFDYYQSGNDCCYKIVASIL